MSDIDSPTERHFQERWRDTVRARRGQPPNDCAELEAIVRDLAANEPLVTKGNDVFGDWDVCGSCGAESTGQDKPVPHHPVCDFVRATLWVSAHPVSTEPESPAMCKCGHDLGWHSRWNQFDQVVPCDHNGCECEDFDRVSAHPVSGTEGL